MYISYKYNLVGQEGIDYEELNKEIAEMETDAAVLRQA